LVLLVLTPNLALLFLIPFGLAYGGSFVVIQVLAVERFGLRDVGRILGIVAVIETCGGATGLLLTGIIARQFGGSYAVAFKGVIIAGFVAVLAGILLNRKSNQTQAETV
ncbi:MAG TPA: hypothetical protein VEF04_07620, partial [Blastocatellia bacterium]|nr:hypothetical protein [Blastocatellia bacterium]